MLADLGSAELTEWMAYYLLAQEQDVQTPAQQKALLKATQNG